MPHGWVITGAFLVALLRGAQQCNENCYRGKVFYTFRQSLP
jgi:hypothetical protein